MLAADRAVRAALDLDLVELRRERVEQQQPSDEGVADAGRELDRLDRALRGVDLRRAERVERVRDLPLQVRLVDDVGVDDPERSDPGGGEIERRRGAETARPDQEDARVEQLQLALLADLRNQEMAGVARALLRRERAR